MKRIVQVDPYRVKVETITQYPKCKVCGCSCHPDDLSKCPVIKQFDQKFPQK